MKYVSPTTTATAFNCPHCDVLAKQNWYKCAANRTKDDDTPFLLHEYDRSRYSFADVPSEEAQVSLNFINKMINGAPFLDGAESYNYYDLMNVNISRCTDCKLLAIWIKDNLYYPRKGISIPVNPDTPTSIQDDYNEASSIFEVSPRGAAALLRLAIQKLCKELGQPGKNINDDIKALVDGGLDPRVQQALDVLRVVGNEAVHPGQMDLRDRRETAESLFRLFNLIVDKTISEPKHIAEIYGTLPADKLRGIKDRDKK